MGSELSTMEPSWENSLVQAQKGDAAAREGLIRQYRPFILRAASHVCKRRIGWNDDEASISLIAFNEAISHYNAVHGKSFDNFAYMVIHNHLVNEFRRKGSKEERMIVNSGDEFEHSMIEIASSLEAYGQEQAAAELVQELMRYDETLQKYGIRLEELEECSPVHRDTRIQLIRIAKQFIRYPSMINHLEKTKQLPLTEMLQFVKVSRKTLERNRKYLIAVVLIYSSDEFYRICQTLSFADVGE